jgi:hypothetical protein
MKTLIVVAYIIIVGFFFVQVATSEAWPFAKTVNIAVSSSSQACPGGVSIKVSKLYHDGKGAPQYITVTVLPPPIEWNSATGEHEMAPGETAMVQFDTGQVTNVTLVELATDDKEPNTFEIASNMSSRLMLLVVGAIAPLLLIIVARFVSRSR